MNTPAAAANNIHAFVPGDDVNNLPAGSEDVPTLIFNPDAHVQALVASALGRATRLSGVLSALVESDLDQAAGAIDACKYMNEEVLEFLNAILRNPVVSQAGRAKATTRK